MHEDSANSLNILRDIKAVTKDVGCRAGRGADGVQHHGPTGVRGEVLRDEGRF